MIKYRVWDEGQKKYLEPLHTRILGNGALAISSDEFGIEMVRTIAAEGIEHSGYIIEQYTGRKDKNGMEIAVGDIVQVKTGLVGEVVYSNKYACFEIVGPGFPPYSFAELADAGIDIDGMVVIGNVHEDGELLEEK